MKIFFKLAIIIAIFECFYLYAVPAVLNHFLPDYLLKDIVENNSNAHIEYSELRLKTHILPDITVSFNNINIHDKEHIYKLLNADNLKIRISLTDFLVKKVNIKNITAGDFNLYVFLDKDGTTNIEKLFPSKDNPSFKILIKNNTAQINNYYLKFEDKGLNKTLALSGNLDRAEIKNKKEIILKTNGSTINNNIKSDFDIDLTSTFPYSKRITPDMITGKCFIRNIDLGFIFPFFAKFIDVNTKTLSGIIDYLQISTGNDNGKKQISINALLKNFIYDRKDWSSNIHSTDDLKISTHIEPDKNNKINLKSLNINSDKIDIKAYGNIDLSKKEPVIDIIAQVKNSKIEDIFAILPQNITQKLGTIEKVKLYGIYGDIDAKANIKGKIPQPDITGHIKAKNVKALDKSIHKLHDGTINITFDKRKLYMDIIIEFFGGQKAEINGYTYMYRDGANNVSIKTTDSIDFPLAQKIIIPVSKVFNFMLGPIPEMNIISGKGIIDINVKGSIDFININGYTEFKNAVLTYNGLYGKIEKAAGRLDFKGDIINFKSKQAFVKSNPLYVDGTVKINDNLDFNIISDNAEAKDVLEIVNNSDLLKDVKAGLAVFTQAYGNINLKTNIKAKIVPVPFGHPPLPPEEAFDDMRVNGSVKLLNNTCYIEGFYTPIENIKGIVNFTETKADIKPITATSGTSSITISGSVLNDIKTKIPDVDITVTGDSVNLKDTIKFLTESYLYPEEYPDISGLYNIASKHNLYFKYKAKSIDFLTDKAYAVMNFIRNNQPDPIKAKSGRIILDKSVVKVENVKADLFDSELYVNGNVTDIDTVNPLYNLTIKAENFNLNNLNDTSQISVMPAQMADILANFKDYQGFADFNISLHKNILNGTVDLKSPKLTYGKTNLPIYSDDFTVVFKDKNIFLENITANIDDIPFFGNFTVSDYYKNPDIDGFFSVKLTQDFINKHFNPELKNKLQVKGDINLSSTISGAKNNIILEPKLILHENADIFYEGTNIGDINEKREFKGQINVLKDNILIKNFEYIKYISSQNNRTYPIKFMDLSGILKTDDNVIIPEELTLKTYKNIPARFLNIMLKTPVLKQGSFNGNLKYKENKLTKVPQIIGNIDFRNINIPMFDTILKRIEIVSDEENINLSIFGFLSEEKINIQAKIKNDLSGKPKIEALNIKADKIDQNKLLEIMSKTHIAMNENNQIKNVDLGKLSLTNGHLEIKELIIKGLATKDFTADFSIDENGIFSVENISSQIGQGSINGKFAYNLYTTETTGDFGMVDVDSNYVAETLFDGKNQIFGNANGRIYINTKGSNDEERIKNLSGYVFFDISNGRMPKLGSLEYLLRASNVLKNGITGFTINNILELLNLVKTGYFSSINGSCEIENGIAQNIEIFSKGENLSLYIHGSYDISKTNANMEILGKLSNRISTIFGTIGNTSLNTFFKLIPGISIFDFSRKNFIEDVEKIPSFTNGDYEARIFQAIIDGDINDSGYVQSFKWVK